MFLSCHRNQFVFLLVVHGCYTVGSNRPYGCYIPLHRSISFYMYLYVSGTGGKLRLSVSVVLVTLCHGGYIIRMDIYFFAEMITLNVLASPNKPSSCMIVYMCHMDSNIQWHCVNSKIWCCTKLNYSLFNYYYN